MSSKARKRFDDNARDVENLIEMHGLIGDILEEHKEVEKPKGFDVLFRSAIVLMVSHWEAYIEDIGSEALEHLVTYAEDSSKLPKEIKKQVASTIKSDNNELEMWKLADDGWKHYLKESLKRLKESRDKSFNTPKSVQTVEFIRKTVGIENIKKAWKFWKMEPEDVSKKLDSLIAIRGEIAHRGKIEVEIDEQWMEDHIKFVKKLVGVTGGEINKQLKSSTGTGLW